jgi:hypothetical protein
MVWTESIWLRIVTSGERLWTRYWTFGFCKMLGSSWVPAQFGGFWRRAYAVSEWVGEWTLVYNQLLCWRHSQGNGPIRHVETCFTRHQALSLFVTISIPPESLHVIYNFGSVIESLCYWCFGTGCNFNGIFISRSDCFSNSFIPFYMHFSSITF